MNANKLIMVLLFSVIQVILSCKRPEKEMAVSTVEVTGILTRSAESSGKIIDLGDGATEYGHCYGKTPDVSINSTKTQLGVPAGTGNFSSQLTNLEPGTKYYIKAYLSNGTQTVYGKELNFSTLSLSVPILTTTDITSITTSTANGGGIVTDDGEVSVTVRGICWNTTSVPTITGSKTTDGSGTGSFTSSITGLTAGTKYFVRAYANNSVGTGYGNEVNFTTNAASLPSLSTTAISAITEYSATSGGNISADGGASVTLRGVCWKTSTGPTIYDTKTSNGPGIGIFTSSLTGLTASTKYYVRAYATNSKGTSYGNEISFTTNSAAPVVPTLTTTAISDITSYTASGGGNISSDGGAAIAARGVCWNISANPTTANIKTSDGIGTGTFLSNLTGLTANTTYYVRAYGSNSAGTAYGNEISFTTSFGVPLLTTSSISSIGSTSAMSGGEIINDCGASVTFRGVCWSTSRNPMVNDSHTSNGTGIGSFISNITGLLSGTTYYVRAYATNNVGTGYGDELSFTTSGACTSFQVTHTAGDVAPVSKIVNYNTVETNLSGSLKCWITQNLGATSQAGSATDATEVAAGWYWQFNRKQGYKHNGTTRTPATTWTVVNDFCSWTPGNDPCTILLGTGWRIPTMTEWTNVRDNGGWSNLTDAYASVLKLHTAGYVNDNLFDRGSYGCYWSITYQNICMYCDLGGSMLSFNAGSCQISSDYQTIGRSVRCIRD